MATNLRLDYDAASAQAKIVDADATAVEAILEDLVQQVEANVNNSSVWSGESARTFMDAWQNCADDFGNFVQHLRTVRDKIDLTADEVRKFDQQK